MPLYTGQSDKHESLAILVFTDTDVYSSLQVEEYSSLHL